MQRVLLLTIFTGEQLSRLLALFASKADVTVIRDLEMLRATRIDRRTSLISFATGIIVPPDILAALPKPAYNLHAASPEFPGRDPHHHAIYHGAREYGATLHLMTARVDAGPIVAVETFPVPDGISPSDLLDLANEAGYRLMSRFALRLLESTPLPQLPTTEWSQVKTSRADLRRLSALAPSISSREFARRYRAFDGEAYDNLTVELHGKVFRIDKRGNNIPAPSDVSTEQARTRLTALAAELRASHYSICLYGSRRPVRSAIIRHDVEYLLDDAVALAEVEAEAEIRANFFVDPVSEFYNVAATDTVSKLRSILAMGHQFGLKLGSRDSSSQLDGLLVRRQLDLLETILRTRIRIVSAEGRLPSTTDDQERKILQDLTDIDAPTGTPNRTVWSDRHMTPDAMTAGLACLTTEPCLEIHIRPECWMAGSLPPADRVGRLLLQRLQTLLDPAAD